MGRLSNDIALCDGAGEPICADCLRRTAARPPLGVYIAPTATDDDCEFYIEPDLIRITEAGRKALERK